MQFTTKADTLRALEPILTTAKVLPQVSMTARQARKDLKQVISALSSAGLLEKKLIIRSSAQNEDTEHTSNAGKFLSIGDVQGEAAILEAVEQVLDTMGTDPDNQVFIQPYLSHVELCGVAFTADPNTCGNYYVLNFDAQTGSTSSVTDGTGDQLKTYCQFKASPHPVPKPLDQVIALCQELETLFQSHTLDLEFAIADGVLYLLQVRPLILRRPLADLEEQKKQLNLISQKLRHSMKPHPDLCGERAIYGVMPDWNPAEMIGIRPRQLALSLYKELITDGVWAYQRDNYGYRNLRSFPLMVDFQGLPYIDTRVSFNSFLPKSLPEELAQKLTEYDLNRLREHPELHDKIEFEIAFTCYTFDLPTRVKVLSQHGFSEEEQEQLVNGLRQLTNSIICENGLWKRDAEKIQILTKKREEILSSNLGILEKIYWLVEYCKRYGTLPFAGLARAGFIAVEFLRSMVSTGLMSEQERSLYMGELSTIGKDMVRDAAALSKREFLRRYGHLRPGTYDIRSPRYDQNEDRYFNFESKEDEPEKAETFKLSLEQYKRLQTMLEEHGLHTDILSLFHFIKHAIEGREYAKFVFTQTLSDTIELLAQLGAEYGFDRNAMSYINIKRVLESYSSAEDIQQILLDSIREGQRLEAISSGLMLPPLLWNEEQLYGFYQPNGAPNFITQGSCSAETVVLPSDAPLTDRIVLIQGADPGYDWIFSHHIAGFVTAFGGVNSHMAIRAAEFGIPAVIGVGEKQFNRYASARYLRIDCQNRTVHIE